MYDEVITAPSGAELPTGIKVSKPEPPGTLFRKNHLNDHAINGLACTRARARRRACPRCPEQREATVPAKEGQGPASPCLANVTPSTFSTLFNGGGDLAPQRLTRKSRVSRPLLPLPAKRF